MADNKSYYYMRLKEDFFDSDEMKLLEGEKPDGWMYSNILLKMYLRSLKNDGRLMLNGIIPYNAKMIASITGHSVGVVEKALSMFEALGLIEKLDNGAIYMLNIQNFIGKTSTEADRKKEYRKAINAEKNKITKGQMSDKCPTDVLGMSDERTPEIEIEKEIDININNKYFCPEVNSGQPQPKVEIEPAAENRTKVEIEPSCSRAELKVETEPAQAEVFIRLPLLSGKEFVVTRDYVEKLKGLYPAVDVEQEFREMWGWLDSNETNRKTPRGIKRFITGWLAREQDRAPRADRKSAPASKNRFNNFPQRDYDWSSMERGLLEADERERREK